MSNYKPGTLVMLRTPLPLTLEKHYIVNGAIGEIIKAPAMIEGDMCVVVDFPQYPSKIVCKTWRCPTAWLIPLSDPDIDVTEDEKQPVEEIV